MHKNYYLFKHQADALQSQIKNTLIQNVYTFNKDEIVFELKSEKIIYLFCGINSANPYILLKRSAAKHKSKIELFPFLKGKIIRNLLIFPFDKIIFLNLDEYVIKIVFFGKGANVFIKDNKGRLVDNFKKNLYEVNYDVKEQLDFTSITKIDLHKLIEKQNDFSFKEFLQQNFGAINNLLFDEICARSEINKNEKITKIVDVNPLYEAFKGLADELKENTYYLYHDHKNLRLSFFLPCNITDDNVKYEKFSDLNKAWEIFIHKQTHLKKINHERNLCLAAVERRKKYLQRAIEQIDRNKDIAKKHQAAVLKGNLLIANKIRIKPHQSKVILKNIYSGHLEKMEIKLNPRRTVIENANIYFNKYKDIKGLKEKWDVKRQTVIKELDEINSIEKELKDAAEIRRISRIKERLTAMHLIQDNSINNKQTQNLLKYSFNRLIIDNVWEVYIGRNGKNNDLLSFAFARKWDIWLHAQGVSGSHVIIRIPHKNTNPPKSVIEKAAQITAYHSKARHSSLAPVIYTYVKYVHRIHKADPGTVKVQNETVIFVKPLNIFH